MARHPKGGLKVWLSWAAAFTVLASCVLGAFLSLPSENRAQTTQGTCTASPSTCNTNCNISPSGTMLPVKPNSARYQVCMQSSITSSPNFSNLQAGIVNMVNTWNQAASQNASGPIFQLQIGSTTNCEINIKTDSTLTATGQWDFTIDSTTGNPNGGTIRVNANQSSSMSADVANSLFTHELGHGVGLADVTPTTSCSQTDSIMVSPLNSSQNFACAPTACDKAGENDVYSPPPPCGSCVPPPVDGCQSVDTCTCACLNPNASPILLAVGPSADYQLVGPQQGVWFDLDSDGTLERLGWTRPNDWVGFLALDRNHNGIIDNGQELFGNFTLLGNGQTAANGFQALAYWDSPQAGGNGNGWIDPGDAVWANLRVWIDFNHDGISQPNELFTLSQLNITGISTTYSPEMRRDQFGNGFRYRGQFIINGQPRPAYDVYFAVSSR